MAPIRSITIGLFAIMLAAAVPSASAAPDDGVCEPSDLDGFRISAFHPDDTFDSGASTLAGANIGEGDTLLIENSGNLDCDGVTITGTVFQRDGSTLLDVFSQEVQVGGPPRPSADFVFYDLFLTTPLCEFRVELVLNAPEGDVVLDELEAGENRCVDIPAPGCSTEIETFAEARDDTIIVGFGSEPAATEYRVYRAVGGGDFTLVATIDRDVGVFIDRDVEEGVTYRYQVRPANAAGEAEGCGIAEATAIPFFGMPLVGALALMGGLGAYGIVRRKK